MIAINIYKIPNININNLIIIFLLKLKSNEYLYTNITK